MPSTRYKAKPDKHSGIQNYLGMRLGLLVLVVGITAIGFGYYVLTNVMEGVFDRRVATISRTVMRETADFLYEQAPPTVHILSQGDLGRLRTLEGRLALLPVLNAFLNGSPILYSIFIGYDDGDFFLVAHLHTELSRERLSAPATASIAVTNIETGQDIHHATTMFFDEHLNLLSTAPGVSRPNFDPRRLPWYTRAMAEERMVRTGPMLLNRIDQPVSVISRKTRVGNSVVGVTILMSDMSATLKKELPTPGSHLALFQADGTILASDQTIVTNGKDNTSHLRSAKDFPAPIRMGAEKFLAGVSGENIPFNDGDRDWVLSIQEFSYAGATTNFMVLAIPRDEIHSNANHYLRQAMFVLAGILLASLTVIFLTAKRIAQPLRLMTERTQNVHDGGLPEKAAALSGMAEIDALAQGISGMQEYLGKILSVVRTIGTERDLPKLIMHVFKETIAMSGADGGGMMLLDKDGNFQRKGYSYWLGGEVLDTQIPDKSHVDYPRVLALFNRMRAENRSVIDHVLRDSPSAQVFSLAPGFADPDVIRLDIGLTVLHNRAGEPLGFVSFYQKATTGETALSPKQMVFWESLAAAISVVLETQSLIKGQNDLRDALIHILSSAIDAKSPYTGGHCARVPVIFQMLLQAACDIREGPFADFRLGEDKLEEARLAAWLHDCGKVTTPEYVMDKATKLETLYDRIHEIRTRCEVLKRDAEIASLEAVLAGANPTAERTRLEAELRAIDEDFAFLASCNSGDKFMDAATLERLAAVGRREWTRTLDKRLGVSRGELARMNMAGVPPPPATECLLADNPEQIIARGPKDMLPPDDPSGFKLNTPKYLYNRGELYNLSIPRGTLTAEERYKINDHITQTILMLRRLPLPKELADMPEIAGAHHETMDGKGYPRRLTREQMSWPARMMAVADIFEALTAWDRPYKTSKTLSEAMKIMEQMKENRHIDPDVYDLFVNSCIPQQYAEQYLQPEQNDVPCSLPERDT